MSNFVAFSNVTRLATGDLAAAAAAAWRATVAGVEGPILVFDRLTGAVVDLDLRGAEDDVRSRYAQPQPPPKRGRPNLGVVAREVTLLPRHWDWLAKQPGGASVTLRRLVDAARNSEAFVARERMEAAYRFMLGVGGNLPGFEEVARALFAHRSDEMEALMQPWPDDVKREVLVVLNASTATNPVA